MSHLLSLADAADLLGLSLPVVTTLAHGRALPAFRRGAEWWVAPDALDAWRTGAAPARPQSGSHEGPLTAAALTADPVRLAHALHTPADSVFAAAAITDAAPRVPLATQRLWAVLLRSAAGLADARADHARADHAQVDHARVDHAQAVGRALLRVAHAGHPRGLPDPLPAWQTWSLPPAARAMWTALALAASPAGPRESAVRQGELRLVDAGDGPGARAFRAGLRTHLSALLATGAADLGLLAGLCAHDVPCVRALGVSLLPDAVEAGAGAVRMAQAATCCALDVLDGRAGDHDEAMAGPDVRAALDVLGLPWADVPTARLGGLRAALRGPHAAAAAAALCVHGGPGTPALVLGPDAPSMAPAERRTLLRDVAAGASATLDVAHAVLGAALVDPPDLADAALHGLIGLHARGVTLPAADIPRVLALAAAAQRGGQATRATGVDPAVAARAALLAGLFHVHRDVLWDHVATMPAADPALPMAAHVAARLSLVPLAGLHVLAARTEELAGAADVPLSPSAQAMLSALATLCGSAALHVAQRAALQGTDTACWADAAAAAERAALATLDRAPALSLRVLGAVGGPDTQAVLHARLTQRGSAQARGGFRGAWRPAAALLVRLHAVHGGPDAVAAVRAMLNADVPAHERAALSVPHLDVPRVPDSHAAYVLRTLRSRPCDAAPAAVARLVRGEADHAVHVHAMEVAAGRPGMLELDPSLCTAVREIGHVLHHTVAHGPAVYGAAVTHGHAGDTLRACAIADALEDAAPATQGALLHALAVAPREKPGHAPLGEAVAAAYLRHPHPRVRTAAVHLLGSHGGPGTVVRLASLAGDADDGVALAAVEGLGALGARHLDVAAASAQALSARLFHRTMNVQRAAARALRDVLDAASGTDGAVLPAPWRRATARAMVGLLSTTSHSGRREDARGVLDSVLSQAARGVLLDALDAACHADDTEAASKLLQALRGRLGVQHLAALARRGPGDVPAARVFKAVSRGDLGTRHADVDAVNALLSARGLPTRPGATESRSPGLTAQDVVATLAGQVLATSALDAHPALDEVLHDELTAAQRAQLAETYLSTWLTALDTRDARLAAWLARLLADTPRTVHTGRLLSHAAPRLIALADRVATDEPMAYRADALCTRVAAALADHMDETVRARALPAVRAAVALPGLPGFSTLLRASGAAITVAAMQAIADAPRSPDMRRRALATLCALPLVSRTDAGALRENTALLARACAADGELGLGELGRGELRQGELGQRNDETDAAFLAAADDEAHALAMLLTAAIEPAPGQPTRTPLARLLRMAPPGLPRVPQGSRGAAVESGHPAPGSASWRASMRVALAGRGKDEGPHVDAARALLTQGTPADVATVVHTALDGAFKVPARLPWPSGVLGDALAQPALRALLDAPAGLADRGLRAWHAIVEAADIPTLYAAAPWLDAVLAAAPPDTRELVLAALDRRAKDSRGTSAPTRVAQAAPVAAANLSVDALLAEAASSDGQTAAAALRSLGRREPAAAVRAAHAILAKPRPTCTMAALRALKKHGSKADHLAAALDVLERGVLSVPESVARTLGHAGYAPAAGQLVALAVHKHTGTRRAAEEGLAKLAQSAPDAVEQALARARKRARAIDRPAFDALRVQLLDT